MSNEALQRQKYIRMTTAPIEKLVCQLALPSMVSMMTSAIYNMADTYFIGKISTEATAAIGIVFPYMAFIQAIGFFFGHGSGNFISRTLGKRDTRGAARMAAVGFFTAFIFGASLIPLGIIFMDKALHWLGAIDTVFVDAKSYFTYILLATPFIMSSLVLNNQMRLQGNAQRGMIGIMTGAFLNIILDPILIFGFGMGIKGAAVATAFSQLVGFAVLCVMSGIGDGIRVNWKDFSPSVKAYKEIVAGGLPSLSRQGCMCLAAVLLNHTAGIYGSSALAAFSILNRVTVIASSALIGFGQGIQPICGFNYGAKLYNRVARAFWFCVRLSTSVLLVISIVGFIFAPEIISFFRSNDTEVIRIGATVLRLQCLSFPLIGWVTIVNMFLQNIRKTLPATFIAMARSGAFFIPVLLIAANYFGLLGIQLTQPIADFLSFLLAIPLGLSALHEMGRL